VLGVRGSCRSACPVSFPGCIPFPVALGHASSVNVPEPVTFRSYGLPITFPESVTVEQPFSLSVPEPGADD
jgi:hypothetical protein